MQSARRYDLVKLIVSFRVMHAGGLSALLEDADEVKKAVEFGTACGAYVTQGPGDNHGACPHECS